MNEPPRHPSPASPPRHADGAEAPAGRPPRRPLAALRPLDPGLADPAGFACDINDPDCNPGVSGLPAAPVGDGGPA